jgi:isopentenyl phosphate kinase
MTNETSPIEAMARAVIAADERAVEEEIDPTTMPWATELATAALDALAANVTDAMIEAGCDEVNPIGCCAIRKGEARALFRAMLAAAKEQGR